MQTSRTRKLAVLAMLSALAFVIMAYGRIPVLTVPPYLKYDPKDVVFAISGFIFGPLPVVAMSVVVSLIEMVTVSSDLAMGGLLGGLIGAVMNILSTCAFACTAAFIYKKMHSLKGAVIGLVTGCVAAAAVMLLWNYIMTPVYLALLSQGLADMDAFSRSVSESRPVVAGMLLSVFLPFNLLKGGLNAAITMLAYKPVRAGLSKSRLLPEPPGPKAPRKINAGAMLISFFVLVTGVLLILVYQGVI